MKTKILSLILLAFFFGACSKDDDTPVEEEEIENPPPPLVRYLESYDNNGTAYAVTYHSDNALKRIEIQDRHFDFDYTDSKITRVRFNDGNFLLSEEFEYDENNKISKMGNRPVTYDVATKSYSYLKMENGQDVRYTFTLTNSGDVSEINIANTITQEQFTYRYTFDETKKGPLANTNPVALYVFLIFPNSLGDMIPFNRKPVASLYDENGTHGCVNTFDDEGFLTTTEVLNKNLTFNYIDE